MSEPMERESVCVRGIGKAKKGREGGHVEEERKEGEHILQSVKI